MHRMIWLRVGGRDFHLLKLGGSFLTFAFVLKALEAAYQILVATSKAMYAYYNPTVITQFFGWGLRAPLHFTGEDVLGVLLGPVANFLFWLGLAVFALMIYKAGNVVVPVEEYASIQEHHKQLIAKAKEAHAKMQKKK